MTESISNLVKERLKDRLKPVLQLARHVKSVAGETVPRLSSDAENKVGPAIVLSVLSGRHAGAVASVPLKPFIVGSSFDANVVITDPEFGPEHIRITPQNSSFIDTVLISVVGGDAIVAGEAVERGSEIETYLPTTISTGNVRLSIGASGTQAGSVPWKKLGLIAACCVSAALAIPLVYNVLNISLPSAVQALTVDRDASFSEEYQQIQKAINTAGLTGQITLSQVNQKIFGRGSLDPAAHAKWRLVTKELRRRGLQNFFDQVQVTGVEPPTKASISAISLGAEPYVVTKTGRKVKVGETLDGGWTIKELRAGAIELQHGSAKATIIP